MKSKWRGGWMAVGIASTLFVPGVAFAQLDPAGAQALSSRMAELDCIAG